MLSMLNVRLRAYEQSIVLELDNQDDSKEKGTFTLAEWASLEKVRQKYKHNRKILTNYGYILIKEMSSIAHARASRYVETRVGLAIVDQCLLFVPGTDDFDRITMHGDGCMQHFALMELIT